MDLKSWWTSKLVWQNVALTLIGACTLAAGVLTQTPVLDAPGVLSLIAGIFGVVVRVWFTDTVIATPARVAAAALAEPKTGGE